MHLIFIPSEIHQPADPNTEDAERVNAVSSSYVKASMSQQVFGLRAEVRAGRQDCALYGNNIH